ncbi:MAG: hypothetical protein LBE85_11970 [Candidatus Accumulibacter sp.]|jgi:hypothetical protein|nr:hypothetical protein [Accumulibacter sp.]
MTKLIPVQKKHSPQKRSRHGESFLIEPLANRYSEWNFSAARGKKEQAGSHFRPPDGLSMPTP